MELRTQRIFRLLLGAVTLTFAAIGLWMIISVLNRGPSSDRFRVWILFKDVQGLQTGSRVVHRGMTVGEVAAIELDVQSRRVRTLVALDEAARGIVRSTSQFWVVRPRFTGFSDQPSGLDTLIKESYVRLRIRTEGSPLESDDELLGLEGPPDDLAVEDLDEPMVGDLLGTVKLPNAHGLRIGSRVVFRGRECGEVRHVRLSAAGRGVLVRFRVPRAHRHLVRENSRFWVGRPILEGSLFTGITVSSLGSLLRSDLAFDSAEAEASEPLADDAMIVGLPSPPEPSEWQGDKVQARSKVSGAEERGARGHSLSPWVTVRYRAVEKDTLSANDDVQASGEGVLFRTPKGDLYALTARSACDGTFLVEDHWYDAVRITNERIRIVLGDGHVWPARRLWVDPDDRDLALLRVQTPSDASPAPLPEWATYLDFSREVEGDTQPERQPPFLVKDGGRAIGIMGQAKVDPAQRVPTSLARVPKELRPGGE